VVVAQSAMGLWPQPDFPVEMELSKLVVVAQSVAARMQRLGSQVVNSQMKLGEELTFAEEATQALVSLLAVTNSRFRLELDMPKSPELFQRMELT
jgi:hypothetical protein